VKISSILIMTLAAGALAAADAPKLDGRVQVFAEIYRPAQINVAAGVDDQPKMQTGVGLRFLGEVASFPGFYYELGGMLDGSSNFTVNNGSTNLTDLKVTDSYWALGAAYLARFGERLTLGAHLEGRGEYLRIQGEAVTPTASPSPAQVSQSTTYLRPWVRGSADYTFAGIGRDLHPYLGVEVAYAITKTYQTRTPDFNNMDNRTLNSLAPKASASLYAGIRF